MRIPTLTQLRTPDDRQAYKLVYQVLSEGATTFQGLVTRALEISPPEIDTTAETSGPSASSTSKGKGVEHVAGGVAGVRAGLQALKDRQAAAMKGTEKKSAKVAAAASARAIPESHILHSNTHLKRNILRTLEAQKLIYKRALPTSETKSGSGNRYHFFLTHPDSQTSLGEDLRLPISEHWQRLFKGEHPGSIHRDLAKVMERRQVQARNKRIEAGVEKLTEKEIWTWDGRDPDVTTPLQRLHLNTRNRRQKEKHEKRLVKRRNAKDKQRAEAAAEFARLTQANQRSAAEA